MNNFYRGFVVAILPGLVFWFLIFLAVSALLGCNISVNEEQQPKPQTSVVAPPVEPSTPTQPLWQRAADRYYDAHPNIVATFCDGVEGFGEDWSFYHWKKNYSDPDFARATFDYALERCGGGVSV